MSNDDDAAMRKVTELLHDHRFGMLTTTAQDGTLVSRPMTMQEVEFDGDLWFFAERESRKIAHIGANPRVNVACGSGTDWVSVSGSATVVDDRDRVHELWNGGAQAWFP
ncbi:MAG: pyridoxamine 5'-phosphate oxidase family protein, partial [Thermoleophilia bacterium]